MFLQRKNPRLRDYDYSSAGVYFVTICTAGRQQLFGDVSDGIFKATPLGELARMDVEDIPKHYKNVAVDAYVLMPNHIHAVIMITSSDSALDEHRHDLGSIIRAFKAGVSRKYGKSVWQRGYHEHIVRNADDLREIREYIANNPVKWELDMHNPDNPKFRRWKEPET